MRIDIYEPQNAEKVFAAIRQIKEATGIEPSPNRVVNTFLSAIDSAESVEILTIIFKDNPEAKHGGEFERKKKKKVIKQSRWVMNFK